MKAPGNSGQLGASIHRYDAVMRSAALVPVLFEKNPRKGSADIYNPRRLFDFRFPINDSCSLYLQITHRLFHFSLEVQ
jgi:hypothetical protein